MNWKFVRFLFAYRNSPHSTTGETPASLMFGRRLRTRLDISTPSMRTAVATKQQRQENFHSQAYPHTFNIGDHVLARDYKGHERWQHGQISAQTGTQKHDYEIEISPGVTWHRQSDQIVPVSSPVPPPKPTFIAAPPPSSPIRDTQIAPSLHPPSGATSGQDRIIPSQPQSSSNLPGGPHSTSASMPSAPQSERARHSQKHYN
ncbi:polyprotein [Plakobranchus ocellatus]|uniref:Polyprotein n=1 Tax=Plakobranchus ocellatus TaxID=259542 RepID=A0AAV4DST1_9GAST|nr:polyprotein [Plakobranchus ocellatus]